MNIFKIIFINSIIYKIFLFILVAYKNSYLKVFCAKIANVYKNSYLSKMIQKYVNSTPLYKYSFAKKINEKIYYFVVDHSKFIYNFVNKTFTNSNFVNSIYQNYNILKKDSFQSITLFLVMFCWFFTLGRFFVTGINNFFIIYLIVTIFFLICFVLSKQIKNAFYNSYFYKIVKKILEMEVSNEEH